MMRPLHPYISKLLFYFVFFTGIASWNYTTAQIKFSAICPETTIGKNDYLQIEFRVQNASDIEDIAPPAFSNFHVVSGPNQQSGMSNINGKIDQYISINFYLKPKSTGRYSIGPARARIKGKDYFSDPVMIQVTNASNPSAHNPGNNSLSPFGGLSFDFPSEPAIHKFDDYILKKGEDVNEKVQKNLFVKLDINKTSCFIGEPVVASYKLYTRLRSESVVTDAPSFNGFSVSDLDVNSNSVHTEKYNGREYNVYTLRKVQLYPLQPGTFTLDPIVTDNDVTFIRSEYAGSQKGHMFFDMLQDFANSNSPDNAVIKQHVTLKGKPVQVNVKPLPPENRPPDFKGAVGNFDISASLDRKNVTTDDMANLKLVLKGVGNIQLVNSPKITWPGEVEAYEAKVTDDIDKFSIPMKGEKIFTIPFTVTTAGAYTIPSISLSYFNPSTESYRTVQTSPLIITVKKGKGHIEGIYVEKLKEKERGAESGFQKSMPYVISGVTLFAALMFLTVKRRRMEKEKNNVFAESSRETEVAEAGESVSEFAIPQNPLMEAHEKLMQDNEVGFYCTLDASIKKYLATKLKVPVEELTKKTLMEELDKCNVGCGTSRLLTSLLDEVELNVYAPASNSHHMQNVYEKASEVVALLEKQVG